MRSKLGIFVLLIAFVQTSFGQQKSCCTPLIPFGQDLYSMDEFQADLMLAKWEIDTLIIKNFKTDVLILDSVDVLLAKSLDPKIKTKTLKEKIKFWTFHKKSDQVNALEQEIANIEKEIIEKNIQLLTLQRDSLKAELSQTQSKYTFNQEMLGQMHAEQELWFYLSIISGGIAFIAIVLLIFFRTKKHKVSAAEKEIVIQEKKVVVHEPHPDHAESANKIAELEKLYRNSLQTIHLQEGEKKETQAHMMQIVDILREAQLDLKKIQENKQMTAEDFMRLSNAVQRSISHLSK